MAAQHHHSKPRLFVLVKQATHFLQWELAEFAKFFTIVDQPDADTVLLAFGPDVLLEGLTKPALKRFAVIFPGFGHSPVANMPQREEFRAAIRKYDRVFINPGPLEIAYADLSNVSYYPFSVDVTRVTLRNYRRKIDRLLHISSNYPQKDWQRSQEIMRRTGLRSEVYPPRNRYVLKIAKWQEAIFGAIRSVLAEKKFKRSPHGYLSHDKIVRKYQAYDAFVHVARDINSPVYLDGKYTASLIEAGMTGCILFWHDTFGLGNSLETVFELPLEPAEAAKRILDIRSSLDVEAHSRKTRAEMLEVFNPQKSVRIRAEVMLSSLP